jgi:methylenetetrahydrofolate dehydrogenase (NADP+)/methenyltetrahydrofolate cyclohydrolase
MKLLAGRDIADFIAQRHTTMVAAMAVPPHLAIVRMGKDASTDVYLRVKSHYGESIGANVSVFAETPETILERINHLNLDPGVTGIIVQLPLSDPKMVGPALAAVALEKDVDGLAPGTSFEAATPKAALWLLAAHNVDVKGRIVVIGQGRLVGKPLADRLEASGLDVVRCDIHTKNLAAETLQADIIFTSTGQPNLIKPDMVKPGAVIVDTGSPKSELDPPLYRQDDLIITPNPGGVGPMTVVSLFDNLIIAAQAVA